MSVPENPTSGEKQDRPDTDADLQRRAEIAHALDVQAAYASAKGDRVIADELLARADKIMDEVQAEYDRRHPEAVAP